MDSVTSCPKCNYRDESGLEFQVCPRCGLIYAKYLRIMNKAESNTEYNNPETSIQTESQRSNKTQIVKILTTCLLCLFILTCLIFVIHKFIATPSGDIVWSQTSFEPFLVKTVAIDDNFLYLAGEGISMDQGLWRIEKRRLKDGALVSEFGTGGVISSKLGVRGSWATGLAVDLKYMYVIGYDNSPGMHESQWRIEKRRLSDGSLVPEFGGGGFVTSHPSQYFEGPRGLVIDANYMYVVGNETVIPGFNNPSHYRSDYKWRIEKRMLSDGSLASDFGVAGVVSSNPNATEGDASSEGASAIAIDGNFMYVIGIAYNAAPIDQLWRIEKRHLTDGTFDNNFGDNGVVASNPSPGYDEAHGIAIDEEYMYVVGHDMISGNSVDHQWHIEKRKLGDGSLDAEFGDNGIIRNNPSNRVDWAATIVLDQKPTFWKRILNLDLFSNDNQAMYVAGKDESQGVRDQQWRIEKRKLSNGSLIPSFGKSGVITLNPSTNFESANVIASDSDYIYVAGDDGSLGTNAALCRIIKIKK